MGDEFSRFLEDAALNPALACQYNVLFGRVPFRIPPLDLALLYTAEHRPSASDKAFAVLFSNYHQFWNSLNQVYLVSAISLICGNDVHFIDRLLACTENREELFGSSLFYTLLQYAVKNRNVSERTLVRLFTLCEYDNLLDSKCRTARENQRLPVTGARIAAVIAGQPVDTFPTDSYTPLIDRWVERRQQYRECQKSIRTFTKTCLTDCSLSTYTANESLYRHAFQYFDLEEEAGIKALTIRIPMIANSMLATAAEKIYCSPPEEADSIILDAVDKIYRILPRDEIAKHLEYIARYDTLSTPMVPVRYRSEAASFINADLSFWRERYKAAADYVKLEIQLKYLERSLSD